MNGAAVAPACGQLGCAVVQDHEFRLRSFERWRWRMVGAAAGGASVGAAAVGIILRLVFGS